MPSEQTLRDFVTTVESGDYVGAIERFYHPEASMQENEDPPRVGRDLLVAGEKRIMATFPSITARRLAEPMVNGNEVALRWRFEFTKPDGGVMVMDEMVFQTWQGERIATEKFYYDPKQMGR